MWQHVKLSEQISPCETLACCWDVKQSSKQPINLPPPPPPLPLFLSKVALETAPMLLLLNTDRSSSRWVEHRPFPFSTPLSLRQPMRWRSDLYTFLKPVRTFVMTTALKDLTLKAARHWVVNLILPIVAPLPCHARLVGQVVKASASRAEDYGFESRLRRDFFGVGSHQCLKIGTPVATLPGAWRYRVSTGTGQPGVSIL